MSSVGEAAGSLAKKVVGKKLIVAGVSSTGFLVIAGIFLLMIIVTIILGSQAQQSGRAGNQTGLNISPQVEKYRPYVKQECEKDGIPSQVNAVLAIIMQESGGNRLDVMQSSESIGLPPNTIQNPFQSIQIGVQYFARAYHEAEKASHDILQTALQGYNFGTGYIHWAIQKSGGYTKANAIGFARIHSGGIQRSNGTFSYGDENYADHVMRYLQSKSGATPPKSDPVSPPAINKAIQIGESYIGHSTYIFGAGRTPSDIKNGYFDCSSFVHYVFEQVGISVGDTTDQLLNSGKRVSPQNAKRGDLIFFDTYKTNGHVGILLGNGTFLNCDSRSGVTISSLSNPYWKSKFNGVIVRVTK